MSLELELDGPHVVWAPTNLFTLDCQIWSLVKGLSRAHGVACARRSRIATVNNDDPLDARHRGARPIRDGGAGRRAGTGLPGARGGCQLAGWKPGDAQADQVQPPPAERGVGEQAGQYRGGQVGTQQVLNAFTVGRPGVQPRQRSTAGPCDVARSRR
jgi:hypothetical protein